MLYVFLFIYFMMCIGCVDYCLQNKLPLWDDKDYPILSKLGSSVPHVSRNVVIVL